MSQLDALLARSRSPGSFVTRKRFTLARHKAIEKMREFSLRHPRQYILELVQAAVFSGATWIAIDVRDDGILIGWVGGKVLTAEALENVFDYLFVDQADLERRHLMQLAVGLNAIYQRKPSVVRIESGDGTLDGTARMELDAKGQVQVGQPSDGLGGTYIYVEFYSGWWERFTKSGTSGEARLVEERCLYTPVPILLNGSAPFGYRSSRAVQLFGVTRASNLDEDRRRGAIGVVRQGVEPQFRIVVGGVWVGTDHLESLGRGLGGVISDDRLRKTADMSDLVRDERWVRMLHAVQPLATNLLREVHGRGYQPPALPPMPEIREVEVEAPGPAAGPKRPVAVPIKQAIEQLAGRSALTLGDLGEVEPGSPIFWVSPDQASELAPHGDPLDFPFHVLVISEGEAVWLAEEVPTLALSRLATKADFGFVHGILSRRAVTEDAEIPLTVSGLHGTLTMRLHIEGRPPDWGVGKGVPALVHLNGVTQKAERLPLELGPVSVIAKFTGSPDAEDLDVALVRQTLANAWRLIPKDTKGSATTSLLRSVLALHARPTFVELDGIKSIDAVLPNDWGSARTTLRNAVLAQTSDGPLTLDSFLALINSGGVTTLALAEDRAELEALEELFGWGHLLLPEGEALPLTHTRWQTQSGAEALITLRDSLGPYSPIQEGWTHLHHSPPVEVWVRGEMPPEQLEPGWTRFLQSLDAEQAPLAPNLLTPRAVAMRRLAGFRVAEHTQTDLGMRATSGKHVLLGNMGDGLAIAPLHGPQVSEHDTVALTFDELQSFEASHGPAVLRFDDPASVWHELTEDSEGWLIRHEIHVPGVEGWIGLRFPYDPTAAILVETSSSLVSLGAVDRQAPCHGMLWAHTAKTLGAAQIELIRLGAIQLYQRLLEMMDSTLVGLAHQTAQQYAAVYALLTASRKGELPMGTARELAAHVEVLDADDVKWGSLERWLDLAAELRPPLPPQWKAHYRPGGDDDVDLIDADDVTDRISRRLRTALSALSQDVWVDANYADLGSNHLVVRPSQSTGLRVAVSLNAESLAVKLAEHEPRVFEMLLLECARQVALWRDDHIHFEDLARMIIAQRLTA